MIQEDVRQLGTSKNGSRSERRVSHSAASSCVIDESSSAFCTKHCPNSAAASTLSPGPQEEWAVSNSLGGGWPMDLASSGVVLLRHRALPPPGPSSFALLAAAVARSASGGLARNRSTSRISSSSPSSPLTELRCHSLAWPLIAGM